jgi:hypothetical protein
VVCRLYNFHKTEETLLNVSNIKRNYGAPSAPQDRNRKKYEWRTQCANGWERVNITGSDFSEHLKLWMLGIFAEDFFKTISH